MSARKKKRLVLMVDDDLEDIMLIRDAIKEVAPNIGFRSVNDGHELLEYLSLATGISNNAKNPCPEIILLDLNMPGKSGFEVLDEMKSDISLKGIPIVILSTSTARQDIDRSYKLGANTFIPKPQTYEELLTVMSQAMNYWFGISRLPSCAKSQ
jgi:CheY-like chemotaxis protein